MLTVHHLQRSQSERIVWLCEELAIPYELKLYKRDPILAPPDLAALTPLAAAPVITDTTFNTSKPLTLAESPAIAEYIIQKHGSGRLALPPSHQDYADYLYWFHLSNGNLMPSMIRSAIIRQLKLDPDSPVQKNADFRFKRLLKHIDDRLKEVPWLAGNEFTAADIMSIFPLSTMRLFYPIDLNGYEGILSWFERVSQRPAYKKAVEKGDPGFTPLLTGERPKPHVGYED